MDRARFEHAAILLAKSLTDEMLFTLRVEWGNTNHDVLRHWRNEVLEAVVSSVAVEPQQQEEDLAKPIAHAWEGGNGHPTRCRRCGKTRETSGYAWSWCVVEPCPTKDEWLVRKASLEEGHDVTAGSDSEFAALALARAQEHQCWYAPPTDGAFYGRCVVCGVRYDPVCDR